MFDTVRVLDFVHSNAWVVILILICNFLMIYNVEHPFFPILICHLHIFFFSFLLKNFVGFVLIFYFCWVGFDCCEQSASVRRATLHYGAWTYCSGLPHCRAQALGEWASVAVAHGLCCSVPHGLLPVQDSNPCPLH